MDLSPDEKRIIEQFRQAIKESARRRRPVMMIIRWVDGIVQIFESVPRGQSKK